MRYSTNLSVNNGGKSNVQLVGYNTINGMLYFLDNTSACLQKKSLIRYLGNYSLSSQISSIRSNVC